MYGFCKYFVFVIIGATPAATAGYSFYEWEWWAVCAPLWIGVAMRDWANKSTG